MVDPISPLSYSDEPERDEEEQEEELHEPSSSTPSSLAYRAHCAARTSFSVLSAEIYSSQEAFSRHVENAQKQMQKNTSQEREVERQRRRWETLRQEYRRRLRRMQQRKRKRTVEAKAEWSSLLPFRAGWRLEKNGSEMRAMLVFVQLESQLAAWRRPHRLAPPKPRPDGRWFGHNTTYIDLGLPKEKSSWFSY